MKKVFLIEGESVLVDLTKNTVFRDKKGWIVIKSTK